MTVVLAFFYVLRGFCVVSRWLLWGLFLFHVFLGALVSCSVTLGVFCTLVRTLIRSISLGESPRVALSTNDNRHSHTLLRQCSTVLKSICKDNTESFCDTCKEKSLQLWCWEIILQQSRTLLMVLFQKIWSRLESKWIQCFRHNTTDCSGFPQRGNKQQRTKSHESCDPCNLKCWFFFLSFFCNYCLYFASQCSCSPYLILTNAHYSAERDSHCWCGQLNAWKRSTDFHDQRHIL